MSFKLFLCIDVNMTCRISRFQDGGSFKPGPIKALLHGKASITILVVSWSLSVYTLNQVACFMQSLFTNCSRQNWESWQWRHYHTNWPNSITTFSPFPVMFYLPCADHVLLFVDDVVTSWPQTKIFDWSEIKCIVILAVQNRTCSIPKCVSCNF